TGTLTEGKPRVTDVVPAPGGTPERLLRVAAALASQSTHPLSQAIVAAAAGQRLHSAGAVSRLEDHPGRGVVGVIEGVTVLLGNVALLQESGVDATGVAGEAARLAATGRSLV